MANKSISVCIAVRNGAPYLPAQLESIARQTRVPDEVIICDDISTDDSRRIVERFVHAVTFPVHYTLNERRLGIRGNFQRAIEKTNGEIIFLADQDDVWHPGKIERVENTFSRFPKAGLVFHDTNVVDEKLKPLGYTDWQRVGFDLSAQRLFSQGRGFNLLLQHCVAAGATQAFRAIYKRDVLPISEKWMYDGWIAIVIAAVADVHIIAEPLNDYRQHGRQALGGRKKGFWQKYQHAKHAVDARYFVELADGYAALHHRLITRETPVSRGILAQIEAKEALCHTRALMRSQPMKRVPLLMRELLRGHYHKYAHGWKTVMLDLFV